MKTDYTKTAEQLAEETIKQFYKFLTEEILKPEALSVNMVQTGKRYAINQALREWKAREEVCPQQIKGGAYGYGQHDMKPNSQYTKIKEVLAYLEGRLK